MQRREQQDDIRRPEPCGHTLGEQSAAQAAKRAYAADPCRTNALAERGSKDSFMTDQKPDISTAPNATT